MSVVFENLESQFDWRLKYASEAYLVELAKEAGQAGVRAYDEILERYYGRVRRAAAAQLRSSADAEDVAQDVFLLAYRLIRSFEGRSDLVTWLMRITSDECRALAVRRRKQALERVVREQVLDRIQSDEEVDAPDCARATWTRGLLDELSPRDRDSLELQFMRELSIREISRRDGIGLSAAKMRLQHALEHTRASGQAPDGSPSVNSSLADVVTRESNRLGAG